MSFSLRATPDLAASLGERRAAPFWPDGSTLELRLRRGGLRGASRRRSMCRLAGAEESQRADQLIGLAGQFLGGGSHLFGGGGVLLDHLLQLLQRLVDLLGAGILFLAGGGDLLHQFGGSLDIRHQLVEHFAGFLRNLDGGAGKLVDLAGRFLAALGQLADFRRHHGESFAVLAGARRFDGRVQGQQVGLAGDLLDDGDLAGDFLHRRHRFQHATCRSPARPWPIWWRSCRSAGRCRRSA